MPLSHSKLALTYRLLAQQLTAGLTLAQALRAKSPVPVADRERLAGHLEAGESVATVLAGAGDWLPREERPFLRAGAEAGKMPVVLAHLAARHEQLATARRRAWFAAAYPLTVFHFGALIYPFVRMVDFERGIQGGVGDYVSGVVAILGSVWAGAILLVILLRRGHPLAHGLMDLLPVVGGYRREQGLADLSFAMGILVESGVPVARAWRETSGVVRAPRLRRAALALAEHAECGLPPGPRLAELRAFPGEYAARYQVGESTGSLERTLLALANDHQAAAERKLAWASVVYPALLFAAVAVMVGYLVIGFVMRYVATLNGLMEGL